jgi:ABC-type dipeptide/oligopeptide/nickel transport system permease subunit
MSYEGYFPKYTEVEPFGQQVKDLFKKHFGFLFKLGAKNHELEEKVKEYRKFSSKRTIWRKFKASLTILGFLIIFTIITWAVFAPWLVIYTYDEIVGVLPNAYAAPSQIHPLGATLFGRDIFGRMIWGARTSLTIGLSSIIISTMVGIILGIITAHYGGWIDSIIMRIMDIFMAFPSLILAIVFVSITGPRMDTIMLAYGILGIPGYTRLMRSAALQERNKTYVGSARVSGASNFRLMFIHILPNCIAPMLVSFTFDIGGIILSLAGLSFLGFGDQNLVEWGNDISLGRSQLYIAPWASLWPGFAILITVLGFMLLGDGLRDALDPRLKV